MRMLSGEKQKIVTGEIGGLPFKAKLDVLLDAGTVSDIFRDYPEMIELLLADGAIVDMKIMKDFKPLYREEEGRLNFIEYWRYDLQLAVYQELVRQNFGSKLPCYILAASKEKTPDIALYCPPQSLLDMSLELLRNQLPAIDAIKSGNAEPENCGKCDYCKEHKTLSSATWFDWEGCD